MANSLIVCCKTKHVSHLWDRGFRRNSSFYSCAKYFDRANLVYTINTRYMLPHQECWSLQRGARRLSEAMTSPRYLMVACVQVPLRIFGERLSVAWANLIIGRAQKQVYLSVWGQKQVELKSSRKRNPRALPCNGLVEHALCLVLPRKARVHPSCLLCLTFNCFSGFFPVLANQWSSIFPPYAPYTNCLLYTSPSPRD